MTNPAPPAASPELARAMDGQATRLAHCVHCGFCLPACPTYTRLGDEADSPRGRLHLMAAVVEGRLDPASPAFQTHMDRCLGCRACEPVCPSGVEYGYLLERARETAAAARPASAASRLQRVLPAVMASAPLRLAFSAGGRVLRATGVPDILARRLPSRGWASGLRLAMGMLAASRPEPHWGEQLPAAEPNSGQGGQGGPEPGSAGRVALLEGCVQKGLFGHVHRATRRVLEANGWEVVPVPGQGCCGALHAHGGDLEGARTLARANLDAFAGVLSGEDGVDGVDHVVVNAAGCGAHLADLAELLEGFPDEARARRLAGRVMDVTELLAGGGRRPRPGAPLPMVVAWDPPCHLLHAQGVAEAPLQMLATIPGLRVVEPEGASECCGGAGTYGITHPELGGRIGGDKARSLLALDAQVVATANPGCQMQIGASLRMEAPGGSVPPVVHPVELLAESYRREEGP